MKLLLSTAAAVLAAVLAGCGGGGNGVSQSNLEQGLKSSLAKTFGQTPKSVDCAGDLKAKTGASERCVLTAEDGTKYGLTVTVTGLENGHVKYDAVVDKQPMSGSSG